MQIYVCVKHVPDSAAHIHILEKTRIDENVGFLLNPYDEHAVTEAVRIKESLKATEVVAVCLGKEDAEKTLRSAMAMGADRGILIESTHSYDSMETARLLSAAIQADGTPQLIFTGKESIDAEGMQTMFRIGSLMGFPVATNVVKLDISDGRALVDSDMSGSIKNTYELSLPCVIAAGRGLNTPGYPTFPDVVKSKKKPIKKMMVANLNIQASSSSVTIVEYEPLQQKRQPKKIDGSTAEVVEKLITILKDEAKVI